MNALMEYLGKQPKIFLTMAAFVTVAALGVVDYLTGSELSFSIFYLLPVSLAAWFVGKRAGVLISALSALAWFIADVTGGRVYSHPAIPEWNALVRLGFFLIVTFTLIALQEAKHTREELIQFVVHDLRSPLSVITLGLGLLQRTTDKMNEVQQRVIKSSLAASQWMSSMINSLLDLSRLESGHMPLQVSHINVGELVEHALAQVDLWAERNQNTLKAEVNADIETIYADREVTIRVLVNLLNNAIKFSPPESVITLRVAPTEANMAAFSVIDQGPGIPEKWAGKVFNKFAQVEARRAGVAVGSGLGLTFCRLAIEAQGGRIFLKSDVGQGTTVTFTLPLTLEKQVSAQVAQLSDIA